MSKELSIKKLETIAVDALEDIKGRDIIIVNTTKVSQMFERIVLASGESNRQVRALARSVADKVREAGGEVARLGCPRADVDARRDDVFGIELAQAHQLVHGGHRALGRGGHDGSEITRCFSVGQVAPTVAFFSLDQGHIGMNGVLQHIHAAIDLTGLFG